MRQTAPAPPEKATRRSAWGIHGFKISEALVLNLQIVDFSGCGEHRSP
jgi:hypothetical protein